jgi:FAD/FMN-containing dehydrogenase
MIQTTDTFKDRLTEIVGAGSVFDDATTLEKYSRDQSFTSPCKPNYVARPANIEQLQEIVRYANEVHLPIVPYSSGTNCMGGAVPSIGGILVDLSGMKKISEFSSHFWHVTVEPGVTFLELQKEILKENLRVQVPLHTPPSASVLTAYLDRAVAPGAGDFIYGNEQIQDFRVVLPGGDNFTIGNPAMPNAPHCHPMGPGLNFYRLFMCAQGTMGICYEMNLRLIPLPKVQKIFFAAFETAADALRVIKAIQRKELGYECFALNNFDLATMVIKEDSADTESLKQGTYVGNTGAEWWGHDMRHRFDALRPSFPPWTLVISLTAWARRPEEKVAYQEQDLRELMAEMGSELHTSMGGTVGLGKIIADELVLPWRLQKRFGYRGSCHGLSFHATADNLPNIEDALLQTAAKYRYSAADVGAYLQPVERARTFYCVYDLHCDPNREDEVQRVKALYNEASEAMITAGAFFDRPYGPWADMMYRRNATYAEYLKKIKAQLDPNNILNPGKLCF